MLSKLLITAVLVGVTVALHAAGFVLVVRSMMKTAVVPPTRPWPIIWLLIRVAWFLILIHLTEITVWALFYLWKKCFPDFQSALYFSGVTYTTVGYGDLVLQEPWRLLGPVEALSGILMCGLSAALFFALLTRIYAWRPGTESK